MEHASLRDFDEVPNTQDVRRDAAYLNVRIRAGADERKRYDADHFFGDQRTGARSVVY